MLSTATGKASDKGAQHTVNGYMAFILFSVAGLACAFFFFRFLSVPSMPPVPRGRIHADFLLLVFSHPVIRFIGSTTYMLIRLFAGE